ncbi:hypothetical protein [Flavobacterium branchiophilum]|nr:hypothetical protein [Flavobacterium branchiophilum]
MKTVQNQTALLFFYHLIKHPTKTFDKHKTTTSSETQSNHWILHRLLLKK